MQTKCINIQCNRHIHGPNIVTDGDTIYVELVTTEVTDGST